MTETMTAPLEQAGPLRFRAGTQLGVSFPKRLVEAIVAPYEEPALVEIRGRMVTETIAKGAYNGIQRRSGAQGVRANRDHDITRICGRVTAFHPSRDDGLVAEIKMFNTDLGDETLNLCDEGGLGVSAGYRPMPDGEQWQGRNRVRITRAWLGHVAFTAEPAYDGARVLSVRQAAEPAEPEPVATPNLDVVRGWLLTDRYNSYSSSQFL